MEKKIYFDCEIDIDIPQLELKAKCVYYLFHEHMIVYPEENKGRLFEITGELQFYSNDGRNKEIISRLNFGNVEDLDNLITVLTNMKNDWEVRYKANR